MPTAKPQAQPARSSAPTPPAGPAPTVAGARTGPLALPGPGLHPNLTASREELAAIQAAAPTLTGIGQALQQALRDGSSAVSAAVVLPGPGGASSTQQKQNDQLGNQIRRLGLAYALTADERYALKGRDFLLAYARQYPMLPRNPAGTTKSRLYWQSLDKAVWLTNVIQGYDAIYESPSLSAEDRATIERDLLRKCCEVLIVDDKTVDKTNNWATWACAGVAMTGYTIGDAGLVDQALRGTKLDRSHGFLWQLDALFSPEGWYEEGPSYAIYALLPFFYVAEAVERHDPARSIYDERDGILLRSIVALAAASYPNGDFPALNDSARPGGNVSGLEWRAEAAYHRAALRGAREAETLLATAARSPRRSVTAAGLAAAQALAAQGQPTAGPTGLIFAPPPIELSDGPTGGLGVLRMAAAPAGDGSPPAAQAGQTMALMKYGQLGGGHGHYDKLEITYFAGGQEALTDYGFVRFIGVEAKDGGKYLPENDSYGRQTVGHNTVVVDERRQSEGRHPSEANNAAKRWFDASHDTWQAVSATADTINPGVAMERTIALVQPPDGSAPLLVDLYRLRSASPHRYDYVLHPLGELARASVPLVDVDDLSRTVGKDNGYQHLRLTQQSAEPVGACQLTWTLKDQAYTATFAAGNVPRSLLMAVLGANDPHDNLRHEPAWLLRADGTTDHAFAAAVEYHGQEPEGRVRDVRIFAQTADATGVVVNTDGYGVRWLVAHGAPNPAATHRLAEGSATFDWTGPVDVRVEQ